MDKFWWFTLGLLIGWVIHWIITSFFCKCKCTCSDKCNDSSNKGGCCSGDSKTAQHTTNASASTTHAVKSNIAGAVSSEAQEATSSAAHLSGSASNAVSGAASAVVTSGLFQVGGKDDLKVIEGIGPKVAEILHAGGIHQFHELAATPVAKLEELLNAASLHMMNPGTWPEQAALIAKGDKAGFERLTEELKGGVRV